MKQKTPGLTLEPFDQDTFQRVWRRVMPDQDLSPIQPTVPAFSPDSPGTPETPTPPVSPCPPQTSPPACLCPDSESYAPCLEQLMEDTCALSRAYQNTARRCGGRTADCSAVSYPAWVRTTGGCARPIFSSPGSATPPPLRPFPCPEPLPGSCAVSFCWSSRGPPNCPTTPQALRAPPVCGSCSGSWSTPPGCGQGASAHCWSRCDAP